VHERKDGTNMKRQHPRQFEAPGPAIAVAWIAADLILNGH
jgi:hypothetical protein